MFPLEVHVDVVRAGSVVDIIGVPIAMNSFHSHDLSTVLMHTLFLKPKDHLSLLLLYSCLCISAFTAMRNLQRASLGTSAGLHGKCSSFGLEVLPFYC